MQAGFDSDCSLAVMTDATLTTPPDATLSMPPSTGLSGIYLIFEYAELH